MQELQKNKSLTFPEYSAKKSFLPGLMPHGKVRDRSGKIKIILVVLALPLLFLLIYWFVWRQSAVAPTETRIQPAKSGLERLEELLRITEYRDLRKFGPWPLPIEPKGKSNPFLNSSSN